MTSDNHNGSEVTCLLQTAASKLREKLKKNWLCLVQDNGIHTMQLSRKFEKSIQRRIFFSIGGDVHLSVHCRSLAISSYVRCQTSAQLSNAASIDSFVSWMTHVTDSIWQLEVCSGVSQHI
jgi:hypothetical protein